MSYFDFKPIDWLKIESANQFGKDKETYPNRLSFGSEVFDMVNAKGAKETLAYYKDSADEPELFYTALLGMEDYINNRPSGIPVRADAASSGAQLLSALMKCSTGMPNTGVIGSRVPDVYTTIYKLMQDFGASEGLTRKQVKKGTVPYIYGSRAVPKTVFGEDADAFFKAYFQTIPAADCVSQLLIDAWDSNATEYTWELPDGFVATTTPTKVFQYRIPFNGHSLTYQTKEVAPIEKGDLHTKCLSANVTHSYDAYMLRELHRRCNYKPTEILGALNTIDRGNTDANPELERLEYLARKYNQISVRALEFLQKGTVGKCSDKYLSLLKSYLQNMLLTDPFEVMSIHDEFMCLPNHMTDMKLCYARLLQESYKSNWLSSVVKDLRKDDHVDRYLETPEESIFNEILLAPYAIS